MTETPCSPATSPGPQPKPGERVWTMTKGGEEARAELRDQGVAGVEAPGVQGRRLRERSAVSLASGSARSVSTAGSRCSRRDG